MKKITLSLIIVLISIGAFSQYQAGNILLSGTLILGSSQDETSGNGATYKGPKTTKLEIGPGIEYFLTDKLAIGGEIDYSIEKEVDEDPGGGVDKTIDKSSMTTILPFASMYFINHDRFALFCKLVVGFGFGKNVNEVIGNGITVSDEDALSTFEIGLKPGISVHLTEKFGMTATIGAIGYRSHKTDSGNNEYKRNEYGLELTPSLGFGIYFKLR